MRIDDLWAALESEAASSQSIVNGWLLRLMTPVVECPLFVSLELATLRRGVLLRLPREFVPKRQYWPRCKGLESIAIELEGNSYFGVTLKEPRFTDEFTALVEDLARRVNDANTSATQRQAFLGQLVRWQKFLSASQEGLTDEQHRGLWGELYALREYILTGIGTAAVMGWKGGEKAHQDFQFPTASIEVKTTLAKQPQVVRITSERQLDDSATPALFLQVIALDQREGSGETLPALVASLRARLTTDPETQERFEDMLLSAGYLDAHASRYAEQGYFVRLEKLYRVRRGFPRLVESDLPVGVGDTNYGLNLAACEPYVVDMSELKSALSGNDARYEP